ncbi:MAG TPA: NAD(P)/FAD-dependent oxidoreductase [Chitinophaga sp.]|uniref:NAD(P)/FAD-dependent oxidoreductase n=1 Tax=Chitinophaga sp. TaxID=1869181 RepID=UPI002C1DA211|nr:NAD(P)/FAD-dependent oxidoreductase [Chitinophaga sp.]HVI44120.1 NAD(P)/FAD-dependent oxidoreductase [Chitinophaga sp.]
MKKDKIFDVIIIGGSYAGLAAGMALGRSLRQVLIIDNGEPCNRQTPHSHNFLTQDGTPPGEIAMIAKQQVERYNTVEFFNGLATSGVKAEDLFTIQVASGETFHSHRLVMATGIRDIMPDIAGFAACWGITVLHCPYCHGYEVRNEKTGILANGDAAFELCMLVSNWTKELMLYTNGPSALTSDQTATLEKHGIGIIEKSIAGLEHTNGHLRHITFSDDAIAPLTAIYARCPFQLQDTISQTLGCELTEEGLIKTDAFQQTTVKGVYACGDNTTRLRTVANAVSAGTTAGMMINREMIAATF